MSGATSPPGPTASDIAAQAKVSFYGNCGSGWRAVETSKMTLGSDMPVRPAANGSAWRRRTDNRPCDKESLAA